LIFFFILISFLWFSFFAPAGAGLVSWFLGSSVGSSSVHLFVCSSVRLFICSSVRLFVCSSVHLFFCSSVLSGQKKELPDRAAHPGYAGTDYLADSSAN